MPADGSGGGRWLRPGERRDSGGRLSLRSRRRTVCILKLWDGIFVVVAVREWPNAQNVLRLRCPNRKCFFQRVILGGSVRSVSRLGSILEFDSFKKQILKINKSLNSIDLRRE